MQHREFGHKIKKSIFDALLLMWSSHVIIMLLCPT